MEGAPMSEEQLKHSTYTACPQGWPGLFQREANRKLESYPGRLSRRFFNLLLTTEDDCGPANASSELAALWTWAETSDLE